MTVVTIHSAVILEPKKRKSVTASTSSPSLRKEQNLLLRNQDRGASAKLKAE